MNLFDFPFPVLFCLIPSRLHFFRLVNAENAVLKFSCAETENHSFLELHIKNRLNECITKCRMMTFIVHDLTIANIFLPTHFFSLQYPLISKELVRHNDHVYMMNI